MSNTIHDMGGMHGFGPVEEEANEPVFHTKWESRVYAMNRAMGPLRLWTIDEGRAAQEALHPAVYTNASYYQRWLLGLEARALQHGLVTKDELASGKAIEENDRPNRIFKAEDAAGLTRSSFDRDPQGEPVFKAGDRVRTLNIHPPSHTRLPRYARDKIGEVEAVRGCHVFPDSVANGKGDDPQWLYTVVFDGQVLWGPDAEIGLKVSIEAFEPYIEAV